MSKLSRADTYVEIADLQPVYCSGLASVLADGANLHFALYREEIAADGTRENVIVLRVVMPAVQYAEGRDMADMELAESAVGAIRVAPLKPLSC